MRGCSALWAHFLIPEAPTLTALPGEGCRRHVSGKAACGCRYIIREWSRDLSLSLMERAPRGGACCLAVFRWPCLGFQLHCLQWPSWLRPTQLPQSPSVHPIVGSSCPFLDSLWPQWC